MPTSLRLSCRTLLNIVSVRPNLSWAAGLPPAKSSHTCHVLWWCEQKWRQVKTVFSSSEYTCIADWTVLSSPVCSVCKQVLVANWKMGRDKRKFRSHRILRLDKTISKFSVADSLDLSPILFTPLTRTRKDSLDRTKQSCLVLSVV